MTLLHHLCEGGAEGDDDDALGPAGGDEGYLERAMRQGEPRTEQARSLMKKKMSKGWPVYGAHTHYNARTSRDSDHDHNALRLPIDRS